MVTTDLTKNNNKLLSVSCLALACLLPMSGLAAEVGAGIRVGASYTDNVYLSTAPEIDDVIFQASPFFSLVHESPNWDANVDYTFDWYRYSDLKTTKNFHRGAVILTGKALQDSLTAELGGRRSQTLSDPDDIIPSGRLPLSGNLIDQDEWWFSPRLNQSLGGAATLGASYRYSRIQFDDRSRQDNTNHSGNFGIENYESSQGLTWALRYDWRRTEYENSVPWEFQQAKAELGFWANASTRIFGAGGKESAWDDRFDPALADTFWEAGFAHSAGENLSMEFAAGERSFGTSWRGNLDYTFRRGSTSLSYNESPTTTGFNRSGGVRNVLNPDDLDDFLDRPGSAERFLTKRLQWDLNLEFRRSGVSLSLFDEDRSDRILADGTPIDDQHQTGIRMNASWQAGVRTTFGASGSLINRETGVGNKSEFKSAGLNANYRLGSRSDLSLAYSYSEQQPRGESTSSRNYVANVISLFFTFSM